LRSSGIGFKESGRESAIAISGWPVANPCFSSWICFAMALDMASWRCHVKILGRGPEGRFADGTLSAFVRIEE
jgi:hypothetical protein